MNPMDDIPVTGGMNAGNNNNSNTRNSNKKSDSVKLGYINVSIGGQRVGTITIETQPFGFQTNSMHETLVQLFELDITNEQLQEGIKEILSYGIEFDPQQASKPKSKQAPVVDFASKFGANKRTLA